MSKCSGCGAEVDGDVCDWRCEQHSETIRIDKLLASGAMQLCIDCDEPVLVKELDDWTRCEMCLEKANERAADRQAERDLENV